MRSTSPSLLALAISSSLLSPVRGEEAASPLLGFTELNSSNQIALEKKFDALLKAEDQKAWLEQMTAAPNHVGSPHDKANAEFMLAQFKEWGWDARIETFDVLYPTPKKVRVEMIAPTNFIARLQEPVVQGDRTSDQIADELPPYNVYGADGDVTAELVYVNQGMPDDYKELAARGIDVKGRIVISRYGGGWRGLKPRFAADHGAAGCIIYSDPQDDGYGAGDPYPKGGFRPPDGVQRGSVLDMTMYPGDPLTPGVGANDDAKRLEIKDAKTVLKIPVLPMSYADAQPLLAALEGPVAPANFRGALPITYHLGPGPAKIHLTIESDWSRKKLYDVIAVMRGSELPDEWVVRGNHHDGWVFGAEDPLSANVVLMAEAKALGALAKDGWRPRRTLVYCSWDGEEPGLLGSTEWAETHAAELQQKAVLYLNTDGNGRGFFDADGSQSLQKFVSQVTHSVRDPETGATVYQRLRAKLMVDEIKSSGDETKHAAERMADGGVIPMSALGSGSDYTAFIDHLGIASLNIGFGGESETAGVYHSAYDSFDHYSRFGDPGFVYGVALAQIAGRIVTRIADADVLPHATTDFAEAVSHYTDELHKKADAMREKTELQHRVLKEKLHALAADPTKTNRAPESEATVPVLNFAPLDNAVLRLKKSTKATDDAFNAAMKNGLSSDSTKRVQLNALFRSLEQTLLSADGLPERGWFRNMIYAPGRKTGYGAKTLPGIREAIEDRRWPDAEKYSGVVAGVLNKYCDQLDKITAQLKTNP